MTGDRQSQTIVEALAYERLLADVSSRMADATGEGLLAAVKAALAEIRSFFGFERCTYFDVAPDDSLHALYSVGPLDLDPKGYFADLRAGRPIVLADAYAALPVRAAGRLIGVLCFGAAHRGHHALTNDLTRLSVVGAIIGGAVARLHLQSDLERLRGRLWQVDRVARAGAITAAIAQEINQPLAAILGNAQAGLNYLDRDAGSMSLMRGILEAVVREERRAAETMRKMREFMRRGEVSLAPLDLGAAVREAIEMLAYELRRHHVRVDVDDDALGWVLADKGQVEQVFVNLVLNAIAAMRDTGRTARVVRIFAEDHDGVASVAVRDAGCGIAEEHLGPMFEPFWTTSDDGLGLGLAICRSIVEAHRGRIWAERNADCGVTVRFTLARAAAPAAAQRAPTPSIAVRNGAQAHDTNPRIVVIEGDPRVRASLGTLLAGREVIACKGPVEFLEIASTLEVGCLLIDMDHPEMSGLDLLGHLAHDEAAPPIVFLTAAGDLTEGVEAMKAGAIDVLRKPVDAQRLLSAVGRALARHASDAMRVRERRGARAQVEQLSCRERDVTSLVIRGWLNKQIAAELGISEQTVKQHRGRVMEKLGVHSVAALVKVCEASGLFAVDGASGA